MAEAPPNEQQLPPAGWYEDPVWQKGLRYWDGSAWTEELQYSPSPEPYGPSEPARVRPPTSGRRRRRRGPGLFLSLSLLFSGAAVTTPGIVGTAVKFSNSAITAPSIPTPGSQRLHLGKGRYRVYEQTGTSATPGGFPFGDNGVSSLTPDQVTVTGANGEHPRTGPASGYTETVRRGTNVYTSAVSFRVDSEDEYTVAVTPQHPGRALVSRSLRDTAASAALWIVMIVVGALMFVAGLVLLIIGVVRRRRA